MKFKHVRKCVCPGNVYVPMFDKSHISKHKIFEMLIHDTGGKVARCLLYCRLTLYDDVGEVLSPCLLAAVREPCVLSLSFARYFAMVGVTHCYVVGTVRLMPGTC